MALWDRLNPIKQVQAAAQLWGGAEQQQQIGHTGSWGTPELGLSELIKGQIVSPAYAAEQPGVGGATGGWEPTPQQPTGQVLGAVPQQPSGGVGDFDQLVAAMVARGYDPASARAVASSDPQRYWNEYMGGGGGGGGVSDESLIESIYAPGIEYLSQLEKQYQTDLPAAETALETSHAEALIPVEEREATQKGLITGQEETVTSERASALSQARQLYNELLQGIVSRFGAGTSAGPAAGELLSRSTMQTIGGIQEKATAALSALSDEGRRLSDFVGRQKEVLASKKRDALEGLRSEFRRNMTQIASTRGQLEAEKAARRLDQLNRYREQAFQIEQADRAFARQITLFETTKSEQLAQTFAANTGIAPEAALSFQRLLASGRGFTPSAAAATVGIDVPTGAVSPFASQWEYVEEQNLWFNRQTGETSTTPPGGATGQPTFGVPGLFPGMGA